MARSRKAKAAAPAVSIATYDAVREAETAGQRSVCDVPAGDLPAELAEALERRIEANLAATGGYPIQSCGGSDPEVERLEEPYRRGWTIPPAPEVDADDADDASDDESDDTGSTPTTETPTDLAGDPNPEEQK